MNTFYLCASLSTVPLRIIRSLYEGVLQTFYKVYYDWLDLNYLICMTIGTILFKTKYLPELCWKCGFCLLDNRGNTITSLTDK